MPLLSVVTMESMVPRSAVNRISVPGFKGLPSGLRPTTVIVDLPFRAICEGLALMVRIVPEGATGVALSQPATGSRDTTRRRQATAR